MSMRLTCGEFVGLAYASDDELREFAEEILDENARLRSCLSDDAENARLIMGENAKLRELVDELYPLADYGAMDASELDRAHELMRELEIGVE